MNGKLFVIDGLDGTGKETQTKLLVQALKEKYGENQVMHVSFPNYESETGKVVSLYLKGKLASDPMEVNAFGASALYSVDRYVSYMMQWKTFYEQGGIVVADRYTTSNLIYQCSKLPKEQWEDYTCWLLDLEYDRMQLPRPDKTIYLRVPPEVSQQLMTHRYQGDESKKDLHESAQDFLNSCRVTAEYFAEKMQWNVVECMEQGVLQSIEEIHNRVMSCFQDES